MKRNLDTRKVKNLDQKKRNISAIDRGFLKN